MPKLCIPSQQERREDHVHGSARDVGADHHELARQTISPDAAHQEQEHARQRDRRQDKTYAGDASAELQNCEGHSEGNQGVAHRTGRLTRPEQPELPLLQRT